MRSHIARPGIASLLVATLVAGACAPAAPATLAAEPGAAPRPYRAHGPRDPITAADIAGINAASAYDAVVKLRGTFLQSRGISSFMQPVRSSSPVVVVDGMEMGTVFELRSIPARDVQEIRFLSSAEATYRYGEGYMAGVIQVTTRR